MTFVYVDLETTGLHPRRNKIIEVAWAREDGPIQRFVAEHTPADIAGAHPDALKVNRYFERKLDRATQTSWASSAATNFFEALQGSNVVGSSPSFDIRFLFEIWDEEPWEHHLFDLPLYAAGIFGWDKQVGIKKTIERMNELGFGLPLPDHTAAGDVHAARELHTALKKMAEVRRFVDDAQTAHEILLANDPNSLGTTLIIQEIWRRNKPRARKRRY